MALRGRLAAIAALLAIPAGCSDDPGPPPGSDGGVRLDGAGGRDGAGPDLDGAISDGSGRDGGLDGGPSSDGALCQAIGECDPFTPGDCGASMGCRPGVGGTQCAAVVSGAGGEGAPCTAPSGCEDGLLCIDFGDGQTCQRMCPSGSVGLCGDGLGCSGGIGGDMCVRVCRPVPAPCDIYEQDCEDAADACTFARNPETEEPYTGCRPAGMQLRGEPCGGMDGSCAGGLVCITRDGMSNCQEVCREPGPPSCTAPGETCSGLSSTWMVSYCRAM